MFTFNSNKNIIIRKVEQNKKKKHIRQSTPFQNDRKTDNQFLLVHFYDNTGIYREIRFHDFSQGLLLNGGVYALV